MVADEENVALAYTLTGTHQGDFNGVAPTGKRIEVRGLQIGRYKPAGHRVGPLAHLAVDATKPLPRVITRTGFQ